MALYLRGWVGAEGGLYSVPCPPAVGAGWHGGRQPWISVMSRQGSSVVQRLSSMLKDHGSASSTTRQAQTSESPLWPWAKLGGNMGPCQWILVLSRVED